ncbi:MAG: hypothetical protein J6S67_26275, partial [Methanobrevibacter sp.]|nr:hypothetical protein [Methanobrevibacter sp.]
MKKELQALVAKRLTDEDKAFLSSVPANVILEQKDFNLLSKWNKLHKTPNKRRDFTFVLRKDVRRIIKLFDSFPSNKDQDGNFI